MKKTTFLLMVLLLVLASCKSPQKPEGALKVRIRPSNAKVKITSLEEKQGMLPVKIRVQDYGTFGPRLKNEKSHQVGIILRKRNFLSQSYQIYEPAKEVTANLLRFSVKKDRIEDSFKKASKFYDIQMAYPSYIPAGFELEGAEFQDNVTVQKRQLWLLYFQWTKGDQSIDLRFLPEENRPLIGRPGPPYSSTIKINKNLEAKLSGDHIDFTINGQEASWDISVYGLSKKEVNKIIKGIKLAE